MHANQPTNTNKAIPPPLTTSPTPVTNNHKTNQQSTIPVSQPLEKTQNIPSITNTPPVIPQHTLTTRSVMPSIHPKKPTPTGNIPMTMDNAFTDPLEHSLASLEQDIIKGSTMPSPLSNISSIPAIPNIPNINPTHHLPLSLGCPNSLLPPNSMMHPALHGTIDTNEMPPIIQPLTTAPLLHSNNNGFGIKQELDMPMNNNGMSMGMPMNMAMPSIFDPLPSIPNLPIKKEEKTLIHPKSIEELSNPIPNVPGNNSLNNSDKKMTPPEQKAANFASAFKPKQEQNIKNASSWSSLAQANSPQNSSSGVSNRQMADSFQQFKKAAKEKADRQKALLEQQEMRRQQKEQAEKERLRAENERRREKEEEEALEKAR